jgi:hypothetical protein
LPTPIRKEIQARLASTPAQSEAVAEVQAEVDVAVEESPVPVAEEQSSSESAADVAEAHMVEQVDDAAGQNMAQSTKSALPTPVRQQIQARRRRSSIQPSSAIELSAEAETAVEDHIIADGDDESVSSSLSSSSSSSESVVVPLTASALKAVSRQHAPGRDSIDSIFGDLGDLGTFLHF